MKEGIPQIQEVKREKRADILLRFIDNANGINAFQGKRVEEVFSDDENKRLFIESLDDDSFIDLMNGINGILRNRKKEEWKMDGDGVTIAGPDEGAPVEYAPPLHEDKSMLFNGVLRAAKEMNKDRRELNDIAILISSSINAIHPYDDANGRTSRFAYLLLAEVFSEKLKNNLKLALSDNGRDEAKDINPEMVERKIKAVLGEKNGYFNPDINKVNISMAEWEGNRCDIKINKEISEETKTKLLEILRDRDFSSMAFFTYLNDIPGKDKYLKYYESSEWLGKTEPAKHNILVDVLYKDINEQEAQKVYSLYRKLKVEYIQTLIDSIANPNKNEYQIDDKKTTILEYFKKRINKDLCLTPKFRQYAKI